MANKYLAREDAPFGDDVWDLLDDAMVEAAKSRLTGRRLLPIEGPYGLGLKTVSLKDAETETGLIASEVLPVHMIRRPFDLGVRDLADYEREGISLDTGPVRKAAVACAHQEDDLIFNGVPGEPGLLTVEGANEVELSTWDEVGEAAEDIIDAVTALDDVGFHGPYALALTPARYNRLFRLYPRGKQTELEHVSTMVTGGILKAPVLESGGVLLESGRQRVSVILGQDMTVGFIGPAGDRMEFFILESLVLRILQPQAICVLSA